MRSNSFQKGYVEYNEMNREWTMLVGDNVELKQTIRGLLSDIRLRKSHV